MSRDGATKRAGMREIRWMRRALVGGQSGFALIVALLVLLLLTLLGLTLATTTSTELQIAANYRWTQQAYYNAESGLEIARTLLKQQQVWSIFLPPPRSTTQMTAPPVWNATGRDFENQECDIGARGNYQGYGVVLQMVGYPRFENQSTYLGRTLGGSFTIWVRRPVNIRPDGLLEDYQLDDQVTIVSEGTAPFVGGTNVAVQRQAVRFLEADAKVVDLANCSEQSGGQVGNNAFNSNFDPCATVSAQGLPSTGAAVVEITPGQN